MSSSEIASGTAVGRSYAYYIIAGTRVPHPRHYPNLAALVGVGLPGEFAEALSAVAGSSSLNFTAVSASGTDNAFRITALDDSQDRDRAL